MTERTYSVSLRPAKTATGRSGLGDDEFRANVGAAFGLQAVIVTYVDGEPVGETPPIAVGWDFGGGSSYLRRYRPTVQAAAPNYAVDPHCHPAPAEDRLVSLLVSIRPATTADWPQIWPFFSRIVEEGETYAYPLDLTSEAARALWSEQPPGATVVYDDGGRVLGTAKMGPNRPGRGGHIGTASFMVDPAAQGRGVGRALGEYVVRWHRDHGYRGIQFNAVVEANTAAVHLWRSLGFEIIGTLPMAFDSRAHGYVGLHVMYLPLI